MWLYHRVRSPCSSFALLPLTFALQMTSLHPVSSSLRKCLPNVGHSKTNPLPTNRNNVFAPWAIHEKCRGGGERLLTLPDTPSPTLSHYQRCLLPGATHEPTAATLPLSDGCGPKKMQVATICTPKSAQTWLWELKPAPRESQTSPGTRRDPGGLGSRAGEETPIYFKMFSDDKTVTWPTAPATNLWMRNSSA